VVLDPQAAPERDAAFVLVKDGTTPLAFAEGYGAWLQWLAA
jgi:hypothetical protein